MKAKMLSLLLVITIIGVLCACGEQTSATSTPTDEAPGMSGIASSFNEQPGPPDRIDVVYFSRGKPCHCISQVGKTIQATMSLYFQNELTSGELTFQVVDLDDPKNAAIVKKYNAATFSLFVNTVRGDHERIVAVEEIWSIPRNAIGELVKRKVKQSLNGVG